MILTDLTRQCVPPTDHAHAKTSQREVLAAVVFLGLWPAVVLAQATGTAEAGNPTVFSAEWWTEMWGNVHDPWFLFGMAAQGLFFSRFMLQWIVSEKRGKSTIPVSFWYLSLAGGICIFVYAIHEAQPVFMLAQLLACVIYIRNLMLIYSYRNRRRRAGLPVKELDEPSTTVPENGAPANSANDEPAPTLTESRT
jgi:lipid-A-disaccharide synthase-like uncharacterized protein